MLKYPRILQRHIVFIFFCINTRNRIDFCLNSGLKSNDLVFANSKAMPFDDMAFCLNYKFSIFLFFSIRFLRIQRDDYKTCNGKKNGDTNRTIIYIEETCRRQDSHPDILE